MIVKVWFPNQPKMLQVRLNSETRPIFRLLSRATGSYLVRKTEHVEALTPHIVR